jgi:WD40 repeat protein
MTIAVRCACGKSLQAKDEWAGKRVRCAACGRALRVPAGLPASPEVEPPQADASPAERPSAPGSPPSGPGDDAALVARPAGAEGIDQAASRLPDPSRAARRKKRRHRPVVARPGPPRWLWAIGGASALMLLVLAVGLAYFLRRGRPAPGPGAAGPPALASSQGPDGEGPPPAAEPLTPPPAPPAVPQPRPEPAPPAPDKGPQEVRARLVRFGRGTIEAPDYAGRSLTGAVVEVEALLPRHTAIFRGTTVTAVDKDGKEVPACLLFIAGGRDGLAPTARALPDSVAPGWVFSVGGSRFDPPGRALLAGPGVGVEVTAVQETTVSVQVPANPRDSRDVMAALPLHLKTGGIELTFLQNRKVSLAFIFPTAADGLKGLKVLGQTLPLDVARRDDGAPPAAGAAGPPAAAPGQPAVPAVPNFSSTTVFEIIPSPPKEFGGIGMYANRRGAVSSVAFSPDGRLVLGPGGSSLSSGDSITTWGAVGLWDRETGKDVPALKTKEPLHLKDRSAAFATAAFSADGRHVLCATEGRLILIGKVRGKQAARQVDLGRVAAHLLGFSPDGRRALLGGADNSVILFDLEAMREVRRYTGHAGNVHWAAFLPDGRRFLSLADDGTVRLWNVGKANALRTYDAERVGAVALAAKAPRALFSSSSSGGARLWDLDKWQEVRPLPARGLGYHPALAPDGRRALFVGGGQRVEAIADPGGGGPLWRYAVRLWDLEAGQELATFAGHKEKVECLAFAPDGRRFLSGSADGTMRLWDLPDEATLGRLAAAAPPPAAPGPQPEADRSGVVRTLTVAGPGGPNQNVAFSRDGKRAVSASGTLAAGAGGVEGGPLRVWDLERAEELRRFPTALRSAPGVSLALAPDGRRALLWAGRPAGPENALHVWDLQAGREVAQLAGHAGAVGCAAFSPDGRRALSGGGDPPAIRDAAPKQEDFALILWDVAGGREVRRFPGHAAPVNAGAFSPDGRRVLSASGAFTPGQPNRPPPGAADNSQRLWDAQTGREVRRFPGHAGAVLCAAFSPDGRHVLSGAADGVLRLFDAETGQEVRRFAGHTAPVRCLTFSPDGRRVLSGGDGGDGTVRLWEADTGRELHVFRQSVAAVEGIAFHADGRHALSASAGTVTVWRLPAP